MWDLAIFTISTLLQWCNVHHCILFNASLLLWHRCLSAQWRSACLVERDLVLQHKPLLRWGHPGSRSDFGRTSALKRWPRSQEYQCTLTPWRSTRGLVPSKKSQTLQKIKIHNGSWIGDPKIRQPHESHHWRSHHWLNPLQLTLLACYTVQCTTCLWNEKQLIFTNVDVLTLLSVDWL